MNPKWILVKHRDLLKRVVVVIVPMLDANPVVERLSIASPTLPITIDQYLESDKGVHTKHLMALRDMFSHAVPIQGPGNRFRMHSPTDSLLTVPLINKGKKRSVEVLLDTPCTLQDCLLTLEELSEMNYELPTYMSGKATLQPGWIELVDKNSTMSAQDNFYAIDCEMCVTGHGYELTRVTVLNFTGEQVLDELVLPHEPITDYMTQYSGITADLLKDVTLRLEDVQAKLVDIMDKDTILLGHSLNSDLNALKLAHCRVIDTAVLYHGPRGPPFLPGLRWLVEKHLGRNIQTNGMNGHDSSEDALACLDLLRLKLVKGIHYGRQPKETASIFSRLEATTTGSVASVMVDRPKVTSIYGSSAHITQGCQTDDQVVEAVKVHGQRQGFLFAKLKGLEDAFQAQGDVEAAVVRVNQQLKAMYDSFKPGTAFIVLSGQGDPRPALVLLDKQRTYNDLCRTMSVNDVPPEQVFNDHDNSQLQHTIRQARTGVGFFTVKRE